MRFSLPCEQSVGMVQTGVLAVPAGAGDVLVVDDPLLTVFPLAFLAVGLATVAKAVPRYRRAVTFWRSDPIDAGDARRAEGVVELEGTVVADGDVLDGTLCGDDCVVVDYEIKEFKPWSDRLVTVEDDTETVPFALEDHTGRVAIDPAGAELSVPDEAAVEIDPDDPLRPQLESADPDDVTDGTISYSTHGLLTRYRSWGRQWYREHPLRPGDEVHVYGPVTTDATDEEWGSGVDATVSADAGEGQFVVSRGDESSAIRWSLGGAAILSAFGLAAIVVGVALGLDLFVTDVF